jgi:hypothetical protein
LKSPEKQSPNESDIINRRTFNPRQRDLLPIRTIGGGDYGALNAGAPYIHAIIIARVHRNRRLWRFIRDRSSSHSRQAAS